MGFEPMIPASERAKTVHILDRAATVIGNSGNKVTKYWLDDGGSNLRERKICVGGGGSFVLLVPAFAARWVTSSQPKVEEQPKQQTKSLGGGELKTDFLNGVYVFFYGSYPEEYCPSCTLEMQHNNS
jgi:hypothetical protein